MHIVTGAIVVIAGLGVTYAAASVGWVKPTRMPKRRKNARLTPVGRERLVRLAAPGLSRGAVAQVMGVRREDGGEMGITVRRTGAGGAV